MLGEATDRPVLVPASTCFSINCYVRPTLTATTLIAFIGNGSQFGGGALFNAGEATIARARFSGNRGGAAFGGGAIFNLGTLETSSTDFTDNQTGGPGGALYNGGTMNLRFGRLSGNSAAFGGGIANGGSDFFSSPPSVLVIEKSVISNNMAALNGGGIYNHDSSSMQIDSHTEVVDNTPDNIFP